MFVIIGVVLSLVSLNGYIFSARCYLKIPFRLCLLFVINLMMLSLYWAALANLIQPAAVGLVAAGVVLNIILLLSSFWVKKSPCILVSRDDLWLMAGIFAVALGCSLTGTPSVIDDYAWWGIISKSIETFHSLPGPETSIFPRHLTYLPGLALFHQFFYAAFSDFHITAAYFGQNLFLAALLFALTDQLKKQDGLTVMAVTVILLILFSGSVFQKLRVDHFLALAACVVVWIQLKQPFSWPRYWVMLCTVNTLYLVKEVGLFLGLFLLCWLVVDFLFSTELSRKEKAYAVLGCLVLLLHIFLQKYCWDSYCLEQGFKKFQEAITLHEVFNTFNVVGNPQSREAFFIFLRQLVIGGADGAKIPYLVYYILLYYLWRVQLKESPVLLRSRYRLLILLFLIVFLLYLAMNFVMQVVIFGLGMATETTVSLERYVNIFFCWFLYFTVLSFCCMKLADGNAGLKRWPRVAVAVAALLTVITSLPERPKDFEKEISQLIPRLSDRIDAGSTVCISPGSRDNHYLGFRLLYHLFPSKFTVDPFPGNEHEKLKQLVGTCDYVLIYMPDEQTSSLFGPMTEEEIENKSLFKVVHTVPPTLEKIM